MHETEINTPLKTEKVLNGHHESSTSNPSPNSAEVEDTGPVDIGAMLLAIISGLLIPENVEKLTKTLHQVNEQKLEIAKNDFNHKIEIAKLTNAHLLEVYKHESIRKKGANWFYIFTVLACLIAVIALASLNLLEKNVAGTLISGIVGFVLGNKPNNIIRNNP